MEESEKITTNYGYIYKTTNLINNHCYVGQHKKQYFDKEYKGSGIALHKAIIKYKNKNFKVELIEWCINKSELNKREKFWISELKPYYNIADGGQGGNFGQNYKQIAIKNRFLKKGHPGTNTGKVCYYNKEINKKIYLLPGCEIPEGFVKGGIPHTDEEKIHNSFIHKGKKLSEETKKKLSLKRLGKPGYVRTEEWRRKMSEHHKGYMCFTNGKEEIHVFSLKDVPEGFYRGSKKKGLNKK